jgi:hypothetical protein
MSFLDCMCKKLSLKTNHINLPISGVGEIETRVKYSANVSIKSCYNSFALKMHCLILPKITEQFPNQTYSRANLNIPDNIDLADPHFNECDKIDLLIGAEFFWRIIGFSQAIDILNKQIYLRRTLLGWVVIGKIINGQNNSGKHFVGFTSNKNPDVELSNQFGTASAPYLATKCLQQLAIDEQHNFPLASPVILKDFYVDDLLTGTNTISKSIELRNQLISA